MNLPFIKTENVKNPPKGYGFAFIDSDDKKLKIKKHDSIIEFNNGLGDIQLLDLIDYTAFEVFAHDYDIPVGEFSMTIDNQTFTNSFALPAGMRHDIKLRSMCPDPTKSDVVVDWGDGVVDVVANGEYIDGGGDANNGEFDCTMTHTYANTGKYIIKIYGKDYYNIYNGGHNATYNLTCRAITHDLPVASHLLNLSRYLTAAKHLLYVNVDRIKYNYYTNLSSFCRGCSNLVKAVGFGRYFQHIFASQMFEDCESMTTCDLQLPYRCPNLTTMFKVFYNCKKLAVDINSLFPERPIPIFFKNSQFTQVFTNCEQLYGTISADVAKMMWNCNQFGGSFVLTTETFVGCSDEIRSQVPTSWGGTASNNLIKSNAVTNTWMGTTDEYNALTVKDSQTLYLIKE